MDVHFDPYPTIHQSVVQPLGHDDQIAGLPQQPPVAPQPVQIPPQQPTPPTPQPPQVTQNTAPTTSEKAVSPDIISLASNTDLSIETIQREADRIKKKEDSNDGEVFISLH